MRRPSLLALTVVAAALPALALASPVTTSVPVPGAFDRVDSRGDFDVEVREGTPATIEIVGEPGMAERIEVGLRGTELRLSRKPESEWTRGVVVKVVLPEFRGLSVGGSGNGKAESGPSPRDVRLAVSGSGSLAWRGAADALDAAVSGSGSLRADGPARKLALAISGSGKGEVQGVSGQAAVNVSGSGDARIGGRGESLKVAVAGSGDVDAKGFAARDATVRIAGSGDVELRLDGGRLDASIAGSGDVTWTGEGSLGAVATAGSGRVRQGR